MNNPVTLYSYKTRYGKRLQRLTATSRISSLSPIHTPTWIPSPAATGKRSPFPVSAVWWWGRARTASPRTSCGFWPTLRPGDFLRPGPQDYISLLADIIERLRPDIAIGRIVSSVPARFTDAPWGLLRQDELMKRLLACLHDRDSFQGRLYTPAAEVRQCPCTG